MRSLQKILLDHKQYLTQPSEKLVNQLIRKLDNDSYLPDRKNVHKLHMLSTSEVDKFLLNWLAKYQLRNELYDLSNHDIGSLRAVWSILSFSKNPEVIQYFDDFILENIRHQPVYLANLFEVFNFLEELHPSVEQIQQYYDQRLPELPAYQLLKRLDIHPVDPFNWSISFTLTTDGEWLTPRELTDEEKNRRYILEIRLNSPEALNDTYLIDIYNDSSSERKRIKMRESHIFTIDIEPDKLPEVDLLYLNLFLTNIEQVLNVQFNLEKIAYITVTKGINRKKIETWIRNRFLI
jgi:hypothetical protein